MLSDSHKSKKVVFISGIFNVLHPGHIRLFRFASELGTKLVVGLLKRNTKQHNILDDQERLMALQSISLIHEVKLVEDIVVTLEQVKPDIVVKGREFKNRYNFEQALIEKWKGKLIFNSGESQSGSQQFLPNGGGFIKPDYPATYHNFIKRHGISSNELIDLVSKCSNLKVAVIGDIIVDEYVDCDAVGLSREDPTIVVKPTQSRLFVGGAAIVAMHAKAFGCEVSFFSVCGDDKNGVWLQEQLQNYGVVINVLCDDSRPTTTKKRYRSQQKTLLRVNNFRSHALDQELHQAFLEKVRIGLNGCDVVIFSDFNYGLLNAEMVSELQTIAAERNVFVAADSQTSSQRGDLSKFNGLQLVAPTELEARLATNIMDNNVGLAEVIEKIAHCMKVTNVLITLGADGTLILDATEPDLPELDSLPALNKNPEDVSGAGDLTLVCTSLLLKVGANLWQASLVAMIASALHVSQVGNTPIDTRQLLNWLKEL